jgi:Zn-dependent peptidase ImmA (M78 family)
VAYNPTILSDLLKARSLTRSQLSSRLGLAIREFDRQLGVPQPRQGLLNNIAKELAMPPFVFFMEHAPPLHAVLPDFRSPEPAPAAKSKETLEAIQFAEGVQKAAAARRKPDLKLPQFTASHTAEIDKFALSAREFFGVTLKDQISAKDAREFYVICRKKIEDKGIFVLHASFPREDGSGFCLSHPSYPVVVVNTSKQTRGRRLFTLIHELAHVLNRSSGISDPFVRENSIERKCNRFAGSFLVPRDYVGRLIRSISDDPDVDDVKSAARRLKISQEAAVLRLEQLGVFRHGSYRKWKELVHNLNPDFSEKGGGSGEPPPQEKVKLAKYGFRFAREFNELLREGLISEVNIYRATGLKPKYQQAFFNYANSISSGDLPLDLDDD